MYSFESRVRYSECNSDKLLKIESIVNYLQDCTMLHSHDVGHDLDYYGRINQYWLLSSWQIVINKRPMLHEKIKITTNPHEFKAFYGCRNFKIENETGDCYVMANSVWFYMDMVKSRPIAVPEAEKEVFTLQEPYAMDYADRKIEVHADMKPLELIPVRADMIDTNNHVNNCQYIKTALELVDDVNKVRQIRADYKMAAVLGDTFYPFAGMDDNRCVVDLRNEQGKTYALVELTY